MNLLLWCVAAEGLCESSNQGPETRARGDCFAEAGAYAHRMRKPLLNVGCPGFRQNLGIGYSDREADVCLDTDAPKQRFCEAGDRCMAACWTFPIHRGPSARSRVSTCSST